MQERNEGRNVPHGGVNPAARKHPRNGFGDRVFCRPVQHVP